ncbi:hypothetical protein [Emticicia sp. 21SJ11W-3]|uniref:hypothetical protein n=1 Tax=Emticicia sp. 21SJ11W-3 TaxID=2916755 RepID=UPI0020A05602|nr:hypothetical protein [Emticicia sp. 21SJ11W-3]UTA67385.1 hypothetical protein MB380_17555 [Emticicia sp. 21SJ11W-3]
MSKKIHDLSDDEFDELFRQSAEKTDIDFDPEAWNQMSLKLDAAGTGAPVKPKGGNTLGKWGLPLAILLLLILTGVYFFINPSTQNKVNQVTTGATKTQSIEPELSATKSNTADTEPQSAVEVNTKENNESLKPETTAQASAEKQPKLNNVTIKDAKQPEASADKLPKKIKTSSTSTHDLPVTLAESNETKQTPTTTEKPKAIRSGYSSGNRGAMKKSLFSLKNKPLAAGIKTENFGSEGMKAANENYKANTAIATPAERLQWAALHSLTPHKRIKSVRYALPEIDYAPIELPTPPKIKQGSIFNKGLNIRLALSPDLSFVASNHIGKIGTNWAALLEYRFNQRLSVQTGVIRSMKRYHAYPYQYEWASYLSLQSPLKDIDATCKMLDIPLNLRYDITTQPNSRWFASAGFTSYIMLNETYKYNYENPADPNIKRRGWQGETGTYPFSVLNLSAGYEHRLFRGLTIQAEPIFKAPLGKVGYGKVRLATAGIFFSVKYPL